MTKTLTQQTPIAFLDLAALHAPLRGELDALWNETLLNSSFIGGSAVAEFEQAWGNYCGTANAIGVANGTDAIELVLQGLGVGPGDEVIIPTNTFVATAEAVVSVGAKPVFVDVRDDTLLIEAPAIAQAITPATAAVLVVHLYGQIPAMAEIVELCDAHGIALVEDAAQAHGALHSGQRAGSFGRAATFSFYPGKNLGALGDGGAIVTNDDELAETIRVLANHGRGNHLSHVLSGRNSRLDGLQAAVLSLKLQHLDLWNEARRQVHAHYVERFMGTAVQLLHTQAGTTPVHHVEVARVPNRDAVRDALSDANIGSGIHYALPCHHQPAFAEFAPAGPLRVAEHASSHQLSLPMHPTLSGDEIDRVADTVLRAVSSS